MRKMGFSNEFVVVVLSIISLVSALSFMFVIKLLKEMRDSGWNSGYNVMQAAKAAASVAGKAGFIERRIMASGFAGQFNSWEMIRQIISAFYEWSLNESIRDETRDFWFLRNSETIEGQLKSSFRAFKIAYDDDYWSMTLSTATKQVSWATRIQIIHMVSWSVCRAIRCKLDR